VSNIHMLVFPLVVAFALPAPLPRKFTALSPLKAAMLSKSWISLLQEVDQKVGVVPDLGSTSVGVQRFGPELQRRTLCARQFERFQESTMGLALADKSDYPAAKRELLPLLSIAGAKRGPGCVVYASTTSPASMCLVERKADEWSVLALIVNPTERKLEIIEAAERATLCELVERAQEAQAALRVEASVAATLAGSSEALGLTALGDGSIWLRCEAERAES